MESYGYLLFIAVIMISTKVLGLFSRKIHMPAVVGALIAGVILGPTGFNIITETDFLVKTAEIGVIMLMFQAGLDTDINELKSTGVASFITAMIGVIVPLIGGAACYAVFAKVQLNDYDEVLQAVFVGVVLTATSVSITVETLRELGKLKGRVGTTILGAAIIDDVIGIIVLTIITSLKDTSVNPLTILIKIVAYFIVLAILAFIVQKCRKFIEKNDHKQRTTIFILAFGLVLSFVSEYYFGIADITGAYFAGLMFCNMKVKDYVYEKVSVPSYLIFSPIFFASIGIKTTVAGLTGSFIIFAIVLLIIAILTKIVGCGIGAKICGYSFYDSLCIGVGMISRGEVALIVAQKGAQVGLLSEKLFSPIVVVVIVTTLITPILLKVVMSDKKQKNKVTA